MTKQTRRQFLRSAGLASAATCVAPIFTPYLYSSEQPVKKKSAVEKLQVGAIGVSKYRAGDWDSDEDFDGRGTVVAAGGKQERQCQSANQRKTLHSSPNHLSEI